MELILIRHLPVAVDSKLCYGQTDVALKAPYQEKIRQLATSVPKADICFSSPLKRCKELARAIDPNYKTDPRLREMHFGSWEMQTWDTIYETPYGKQWMNNYTQLNTPGGESFQDVWVRALSFLRSLEKRSYQRAIIVTHAGVIRSLCAIIDEVSISRAFDLKVEYGQVLRRHW